jgi:hypothetical protein
MLRGIGTAFLLLALASLTAGCAGGGTKGGEAPKPDKVDIKLKATQPLPPPPPLKK